MYEVGGMSMLRTAERVIPAQDLVQQVEAALANVQQEPLLIAEQERN